MNRLKRKRFCAYEERQTNDAVEAGNVEIMLDDAQSILKYRKNIAVLLIKT